MKTKTTQDYTVKKAVLFILFILLLLLCKLGFSEESYQAADKEQKVVVDPAKK